MVLIEGRSFFSVGMTVDEVSAFCEKYLKLEEAIVHDGGGPSIMVVNGLIKNFPGNYYERQVSNGIAIYSLLPRETSSKFVSGEVANTRNVCDLLLGPGTNFRQIDGKIFPFSAGTIVEHTLSGVKAKGHAWWKVNSNGKEGWIDEDCLDNAEDIRNKKKKKGKRIKRGK